jgi:RNA polymerase sigma factor (sigma-70 family)
LSECGSGVVPINEIVVVFLALPTATWLMAIARYKALSVVRQRIDAPLDESVAESVEDDSDDPETAANTAKRSEIIRKCLMQLTAAHREVMDLVYYHDKSVDEIAQIVGISPSTVKRAPRKIATSANLCESDL